jgi:two-component system cell cycle response regulator
MSSVPTSGRPSPQEAPALKVLVVDDDGANRLLAVRWLERVGLATAEAENGGEALQMLKAAPGSYGAVLLDVVMPMMTGYDVLGRIQSDVALRDVPVVILTAHVQQENDVLYGLRNGAVDHLSKPFRGPILAAKVQSLVDRRARQLALEERLRDAEARATTDFMTGLGNRRQFDQEFEREMAFTTRHHAPLALLLVDIDNLKVINDVLGHAAGDRAISWAADGLRRTMRCTDRGFRIGGDEFAVLLRGLDRNSGARAARRFVKSREKQPLSFDDSDAMKVTVSVGVAAADDSNGYDVRELFQRADRALYAAKNHPDSWVESEPG